MIRTILLVASSFLLVACERGPVPVAGTPRNNAVCTALKPSYPLPEMFWNSEKDSANTIARAKNLNRAVEQANARYQAACDGV